MRTIKFRAWDTNRKEMKDVIFINWYDGYLWVDETPMTGHKLPIEGTPLMQFTGLLDKNGKEIFEGDVIYSDQWTPTTYQVAFDQNTFYIAGADLHECADIKYAEKFELIGNIYENPDLLKCN